jgi:hypothetical protein
MTQLNREYIESVLLRVDVVGMVAVGRALVHLMNRQTADEQASEQTRYFNNRGFTSGDAKRGTSMAKGFIKYGRLTPKQVAYWQRPADLNNPNSRPRICKYALQILEEARAKQAQSLL